jgi:hypothetical protein
MILLGGIDFNVSSCLQCQLHQLHLVSNTWKNTLLVSKSGLPDGIFSNQKSLFGYIWWGLTMKDVGVLLYYHSVYFTAIWYSLGPFGICVDYLVYFFSFWYVAPRKIWQSWSKLHFWVKTNCADMIKSWPLLIWYYVFLSNVVLSNNVVSSKASFGLMLFGLNVVSVNNVLSNDILV